MAALLAGGVTWIFHSFRKEQVLAGSLGLATVELVFVSCAGLWVMPAVNEYKSPQILARSINKIMRPSDSLYIYRDTMNDFNFYLRREIIPVLSGPGDLSVLEKEPNSYLLIRDRGVERLLSETTPRWTFLLKAQVGSKNWLLVTSRQ
jgi:hypothetical protein